MSQVTYITVRVTPRSGRDEVLGTRVLDDGVTAICVRVTAPPDGGKANKAVCKVIAQSLGVAKTAIAVEAGATARRKRLSVAASEQFVASWVASLPTI